VPNLARPLPGTFMTSTPVIQPGSFITLHYRMAGLMGDVVQFPTPDGKGQFAGAVRQFRADEKGEAVLSDFNHPLAG